MTRAKKPLTLYFEPDTVEEMEAWLKAQTFPPPKTAVVELALREFLASRRCGGEPTPFDPKKGVRGPTSDEMNTMTAAVSSMMVESLSRFVRNPQEMCTLVYAMPQILVSLGVSVAATATNHTDEHISAKAASDMLMRALELSRHATIGTVDKSKLQ